MNLTRTNGRLTGITLETTNEVRTVSEATYLSVVSHIADDNVFNRLAPDWLTRVRDKLYDARPSTFDRRVFLAHAADRMATAEDAEPPEQAVMEISGHRQCSIAVKSLRTYLRFIERVAPETMLGGAVSPSDPIVKQAVSMIGQIES